MQLATFLDAHPTMLWLQLPDAPGRWYRVGTARGRIPPAHLAADALITKSPGLDTGALWIEELTVEYRWAMEHDHADVFRPHPWPWPPLAERAG